MFSEDVFARPAPVRWWTCVVALLLLANPFPGIAVRKPGTDRGMVASVHPAATQAGLRVLQRGGNAIDAAVAVGLTLGVVDSHNSGIGGGCFLLIRLADGKVVAIDGREVAPAKATRDMFVRDGKGDTALSQTGPLASGVPGELAAFEYAVSRFGRTSLSDLLLPAADLAERGFSINLEYAERLAAVAQDMAKFEASQAVFFRGGKPLAAGELLKQPDLAATYRAIADYGTTWFYRGPFATAVETWMNQNGGILTSNDLASYQVILREPVETVYRGHRIVSFPPPSSGGVHLAQMLNIVERFNLRSMDQASRMHVMAEAMKLAFADRAFWLGDPDFANVPRGLTSKTYSRKLAKGIDLHRAALVKGHGQPPGWETDHFRKHTTHFSVADAEGNWVACTATVNTTFGSKVVIPGTGVVMNNQMDDFSIQPGVANFFGLIGAEANAIDPGKRPLSSMTPTIVLKGKQPIIALGAAGGPKIISAVFQELVAMIDLGKTAEAAAAELRFHQQWSPNELLVERGLPPSLLAELEKRGHRVKLQGALSTSQIVARDPRTGTFEGAADPRVHGSAQGF